MNDSDRIDRRLDLVPVPVDERVRVPLLPWLEDCRDALLVLALVGGLGAFILSLWRL